MPAIIFAGWTHGVVRLPTSEAK